MPEQLLHPPDIDAGLQQMRRKRVAKRMRGHPLADLRGAGGARDGAADRLRIHVVTTANPAAWIRRQCGGRPHPEPVPGLGRPRILDGECVGQFHAGHSRDPIALPELAGIGELPLQRLAQCFRKHHHPILGALSLANDDHRSVEVDILGPQPQAFEQAHARPIQGTCDHAMGAIDRGQETRDLLARQHRGHTYPGLRAAQVLHPGQLLAQNLPIEE